MAHTGAIPKAGGAGGAGGTPPPVPSDSGNQPPADGTGSAPAPEWKMNEDYTNNVQRRFKDVYDLKEELGRGGFGTVKKAVFKKDKRQYAVKFNNAPDKKASMEEEKTVSAALSSNNGHPNIINIFDSITENQIVYNVFELATGSDLNAEIYGTDPGYFGDTQNPERMERASSIFKQIIEGVAHIHKCGYIHTDLKPGNIMILCKEVPVIKITDYGLVISTQAKRRGPRGTTAYMAQEMVTAPRYNFTESCDLWSCGVILYEMMIGYKPFQDADITNLHQLILGATKQPSTLKFSNPEWDGLDEAEDLIKNLIAVESARFKCDQVLAHPFITKKLVKYVEPTMGKFYAIDKWAQFKANRFEKAKMLHKLWNLPEPNRAQFDAMLEPQAQAEEPHPGAQPAQAGGQSA